MSDWAEAWQQSWDRQQEGYMPDREQRLDALLDLVEAVTLPGTAPLVIDLACGTGSITRRLLARFPRARSIAVDVDPALLAIAAASFAGDERVQLVEADLTDPSWARALPAAPVDAVLTATALHWLGEPLVRRLYHDLHGVVRPGGVVANVDVMVPASLPRLSTLLEPVERRRTELVRADGRPDWHGWWEEAGAEPRLAAAVAERQARFGIDHDDFDPPSRWHADALLDAGFAEAGVTWRSGTHALVAALR